MNFNIDTLHRMRKLLLSSVLSLPPPSMPEEKVGPFQIPSALKVPYFDTSKEGAQDVFGFFSCYEARLAAVNVSANQWANLLLLTVPESDIPTIN